MPKEVLDFKVDVEGAAAEVEFTIDAKVGGAERAQPIGAQCLIIDDEGRVGVDALFPVDLGKRGFADPACSQTELPAAAKAVSAREGEQVAAVPGGWQIFSTIEVGKLTPKQRVRSNPVHIFHEGLLRLKLYTIGATFAAKRDRLVAQNPKVGAKIGQTHLLSHRHRIVLIPLHKRFRRDHSGWTRKE